MKIENSPGSYGFLAGTLVLLLGILVAQSGCAHAASVPPVAAVAAVALDGEAPVSKASVTYQRQSDMIDAMRLEYPRVKAAVHWMPCGMVNSFYYPDLDAIVLCTEFEAYPEVAVFVAAHEFAHAVTDQLLFVTDENDADEIAALSMIKAGKTMDILGAALWWAERDYQDQWPGDDHPAAGFRAWEIMCLAVGSEASGDYPECEALYKGIELKWSMRLNNWLVPTAEVDGEVIGA